MEFKSSFKHFTSVHFREADQKQNPKAVVTALKFYASAMKQRDDDKFLMTAKSVCPSDDDIDVELDVNKTQTTSKADKIVHGLFDNICTFN